MVNKLSDVFNKRVFIIAINEHHQTVIVEAIPIGERDAHFDCRILDQDFIQKCKYRRPSQVFLTREEAQKELDDLNSYIAYRMSSHKMK